MTARPPVLYPSHGAPPLADDPIWPGQLQAWSATIEKPTSILMVSAHWEAAPITVSASAGQVPLLYDFWGFPRHYYEVTYAAPTAPGLAASVDRLLGGVHRDESRGLDHGAYVPLVEMFPDADVPVLQLSLPTLHPRELFTVGQSLAPLRDEGTPIVGSGVTTARSDGRAPRTAAGCPLGPTPSNTQPTTGPAGNGRVGGSHARGCGRSCGGTCPRISGPRSRSPPGCMRTIPTIRLGGCRTKRSTKRSTSRPKAN